MLLPHTCHETISSVCALSPLCSRKLSWHARRRTRGCGRRASVSAIRDIGVERSEPVVARHSQACSGSTSCNRRGVSRSPHLSAQSHLQPYVHTWDDHIFPSCTTAGSRSAGPLTTPRYLDAGCSNIVCYYVFSMQVAPIYFATTCVQTESVYLWVRCHSAGATHASSGTLDLGHFSLLVQQGRTKQK